MKERFRMFMFRVETRIAQYKAHRGERITRKLDKDIGRYFAKYQDLILVKCGKDPLMEAMAIEIMQNQGIAVQDETQSETQDDTQDVFDI